MITEKMKEKIPSWPPIYPETAEKLKEIYLSGRWSFNGEYEQKFSREFADYCNAKYGIFMANGTVTLESALTALGVGKGDEVIVPALTWMATAMAVVYTGATPVFVDIEADTLCLDPEKAEKAITPKTKAIIPVHIYGSMADMEKIMALAEKYNIGVVEDCAHAHGGVWNGRGVGSIGDVGSFSFQQSKSLSSGEGGICLTNNPDIYEKIFRFKHIGYNLGAQQGQADSGPPTGLICHNYRGTEFPASILCDALKHLKQQTETRDKNAAIIRGILSDIPGVRVQARGRLADLQGYYAFSFMIEPEKLNDASMADFQTRLNEKGVLAGRTYGPVYDHMLWSVPNEMFRKEDCSKADDICANKAFCLGQNWLLADEDLVKALGETIKETALSFAKK
jgi:L-glutamine:2-deoxy-scyllo-inosose/3-amino-2,3-dideoxy-scyllo-inosose aminotransferase